MMNTSMRCWRDNATWQPSHVAAKIHQHYGLNKGRSRKSKMDVATFSGDAKEGQTMLHKTAMGYVPLSFGEEHRNENWNTTPPIQTSSASLMQKLRYRKFNLQVYVLCVYPGPPSPSLHTQHPQGL